MSVANVDAVEADADADEIVLSAADLAADACSVASFDFSDVTFALTSLTCVLRESTLDCAASASFDRSCDFLCSAALIRCCSAMSDVSMPLTWFALASPLMRSDNVFASSMDVICDMSSRRLYVPDVSSEMRSCRLLSLSCVCCIADALSLTACRAFSASAFAASRFDWSCCSSLVCVAMSDDVLAYALMGVAASVDVIAMPIAMHAHKTRACRMIWCLTCLTSSLLAFLRMWIVPLCHNDVI